MVREIVIVRHGLCSGNAAERASSKGDHSLFTETMRQQSSSEWPLLPEGIRQSQEAGRWIRSSIADEFDCYLTSGMTRADETAFHLGFRKAIWKTEGLLKERSWGGVECLPNPERLELCRSLGVSPVEDSVNWNPPGGESMVTVMQRIHTFLKSASQRFKGKRLLLVSHGAPIHALRVIQHQIANAEYLQFISDNKFIRNCHIFHFYELRGNNGGFPSFKFERSAYPNPDGTWSSSVRTIK